MSPLLSNVLALSVAFVIAELLLAASRAGTATYAEALWQSMPRLAFAVTIGAVLGLGLHLFGIQVVP